MLRLGLILLVSGCGPNTFAASSFDANDEGWTLNGDAATRVELRSPGGNPGGHICGRDSVNGDLWYFIAPSRFLGDVSKVYGQRLTWDLKQDNLFQQISGRDVVIQGNGNTIIFDIRSTPAKDWTSYEARLDAAPASGWKLDLAPAFPPVTEEQMKGVLRNVVSLRLRGEFTDGPDSACLDNVYFGIP